MSNEDFLKSSSGELCMAYFDKKIQLELARAEIAQLKALLDLSEDKHDLLVDANKAAMREASDLAMWLFKKHYANKPDSVEFSLCDSPVGVISQIDNMVCGLVDPCRLADVKADAIDRLAEKFINRFESEGHYHWIVGISNKIREGKS